MSKLRSVLTAQQNEIERLTRERNGYKADLDRVAAAVYPQKQDRFTYSVDFMIEEVQKLQRENAEAHQRAEDAIAVLLRTSTELAAAEAALLDIYKTAKEACANPRHLTTDVACSRLTYIIGFCERTGLRPEVIDAAKTEVKACPDCERAKKLAGSEFTTPGFFYTECDKHRAARGDKP